jgi:hypothetical protein
VRFVEFLKTTVLLSAAAATALAVITVLAANEAGNERVVIFGLGWWAIAVVVGLWLGRRAETNPPIARLLAGAKATNTMPGHHPGAVLINRLWPLFLFTVLAGGLGLLAPQIPGIGVGFAIIWALAWRRQHAAVAAIEERDGASFFVERTSPLRPMTLLRTPGFKTVRPEGVNGTAG